MESLRIVRIRYKDVACLKEFVLQPGGITELTGANGSGKTSACDGLVNALAGGSTPEIVRTGADRAEVQVDLSNGDAWERIIPRVGTPMTRGRLADGSPAKRPAETLRSMVARAALNPLDVLEPANRRAFLMSLVGDVRLTREELASMLGEDPPPVDLARPGVEVLAAVHDYLYLRRTEAGRLKDRKAHAAEDARGKLPTLPARTVPIPEESRQVQADIAQAAAAIQQEKNKATAIADYAQRIDAAQQGRDAQAKRCEDLQFQLAGAQAELARRDGELSALRERSALDTPNEDIMVAARDQVAHGQARLAELGHEQAARAEYARVASLDAEVREATEVWAKLETQVTATGPAAQSALLARAGLPAGLSYREGDFWLGDRLVARLSTGEALMLAVPLVKATVPADVPLKLMVLDGAERLDRANRAALIAEAGRDGGQGWTYLLTTVGDGPLTVAHLDAPEIAHGEPDTPEPVEVDEVDCPF